MTQSKTPSTSGLASRAGIILSGGNGERLRELIYRRRGDYLPKQYLNFLGTRSMLEHTIQRAETVINPEKLFVVIGKEHLEFKEVRRQLASRLSDTVIVQPANKDTAPGILLPLLHIQRRFPAGLVAVFPSDHFIFPERAFMNYVEYAFGMVERDGSRIVLLGAEPREPDPEYGYILPGKALDNSALGPRTVKVFVEKPATEAAQNLMRAGGLWNTLVFAARAETLVQAFRVAEPELYRSFEKIETAIGTPDEQRALSELYRGLPKLSFSRRILENLPGEFRDRLTVLIVPGLTWSDWGTPERLVRDLMRLKRVGSAIAYDGDTPRPENYPGAKTILHPSRGGPARGIVPCIK